MRTTSSSKAKSGVKRPIDGWYAVKTNTGEVGYVNHTSGGYFNLGNGQSVIGAVYLGAGNQSLGQLLGNDAANALLALHSLGASGTQEAALIGQADIGAGQNSKLKQLLVSLTGKPAASTARNPISTRGRGDAVPMGLGPNQSTAQQVGGIWGDITSVVGVWGLTAALVVGGIVLVIVGLSKSGAKLPQAGSGLPGMPAVIRA